MKSTTTYVCILLVSFLGLISCSKENDPGTNNAPGTIGNGNWVVSQFSERGENHSSDFSGYEFDFQSNGKLVVSGTANKEGTWSENGSSHRLIIDLGPKEDDNKPLGELTDDWVIVSKSDAKISLKDDNDASNEILEFTKK